MSVILAVDPSWTSTGWCLVVNRIPRVAGSIAFGPEPRRRLRLAGWLREMDAMVAEQLLDPAVGGRPRLVIEEVPDRYRGGGAGGKAASASQVQRTIKGLAAANSAILQHFVRPDWDHPWELQPDEWRAWWGWRGGTRDRLKAAALAEVDLGCRSGLWPEALRRGRWTDDAAEATLLGVGAARNLGSAPENPRWGML